ncbi:S8 family serine peptidase [Pontibacter harenae]|uniref:S8 family serine peptidase n=1 Tax=Pontibacter harenae TaxID=2894083 RepID=UPI001E509F0E|nr:S8 family serine peptidase [Pontibacter harenae]MCC9167666.1 S8 family serine peptidase [Pontibacter harenae]
MKQQLRIKNLLRSVLFGATVTATACTFTACDQESVEALEPTEELQITEINGAVIPGKYIVVFKKDDNLRLNSNITYQERVDMVRALSESVLEAHGVASANIEQTYGQAITGMAVTMSETEAELVRADPRVSYVEPDRMMVLARPGSGGGGSTAQEVPYGIARVGYASGVGKTAWVIDTGVDLNHPDLIVDGGRSRTFISSGKDARDADDGNGHGTHVAGTIAARNNSTGVLGVAYDATVVAVKVLDSRGSGAYSTVIAGVDYVAANGKSGDVANMSLGGPISQALDDAVLAAAGKGIKFALAAGNDGADANYSSPARVNHANVYTVSAMDANDRFASFSNYGNPPVDYCAPGVSIKSTWKDGAYNTISGTSMAAPHVAGLLLLSISTDGTVSGDPDGNPDPIAHL